MSEALRRLSARAASLVARAESGQLIDWRKERLVSDLETVAAGVEFAADAVERTRQADDQQMQRQDAADGVQNG